MVKRLSPRAYDKKPAIPSAVGQTRILDRSASSAKLTALSTQAKNVTQTPRSIVKSIVKITGIKDPMQALNSMAKSAVKLPKSISAPPQMTSASLLRERLAYKFVPLEPDPEPQLVTEYAADIFLHLSDMESRGYIQIRTRPEITDYMQLQPQLNWTMRTRLLCWLVQVHNRFRLLPETFFLTVNIIDRFLSQKPIPLDKLQLVGITALLIASKFEETLAPCVADLVYMTDHLYSHTDLLQSERFILGLLQFDLGYPGPFNFMRRISKADGYDATIRNLAKFFLEVAAMDARMIGILPSKIAASAMFLARKVAYSGEWTQQHCEASGYTEPDLLDCVYMLLEDVKHTCVEGFKLTGGNGNGSSSHTGDRGVEVVYEKYATEKHGQVAVHMLEFLGRMRLI
eukprot:jgi/Hompol1/4164/HPOL_003506-RA